MYPTDKTFRPNLDTHHDPFKWVDHIPNNLHPYVEQCLRGAGLTKKTVN